MMVYQRQAPSTSICNDGHSYRAVNCLTAYIVNYCCLTALNLQYDSKIETFLILEILLTPAWDLLRTDLQLTPLLISLTLPPRKHLLPPHLLHFGSRCKGSARHFPGPQRSRSQRARSPLSCSRFLWASPSWFVGPPES